VRAADVARVKNPIDVREEVVHSRMEDAVRIGDDADA
jgi:hypothetical protein